MDDTESAFFFFILIIFWYVFRRYSHCMKVTEKKLNENGEQTNALGWAISSKGFISKKKPSYVVIRWIKFFIYLMCQMNSLKTIDTENYQLSIFPDIGKTYFVLSCENISNYIPYRLFSELLSMEYQKNKIKSTNVPVYSLDNLWLSVFSTHLT